MTGVFVQVNTDPQWAQGRPVGYMMKQEGCWEWVGSKEKTGYGFLVPRGTNRKVWAHRWSYEHHRSPIPPGLVIDHLCRNRGCVNPDHLEVVTNGENVLRGISGSALNRHKTVCKYGHPLTEGHYYATRGRKGFLRRVCKVCSSQRCADYYQRQKRKRTR